MFSLLSVVALNTNQWNHMSLFWGTWEWIVKIVAILRTMISVNVSIFWSCGVVDKQMRVHMFAAPGWKLNWVNWSLVQTGTFNEDWSHLLDQPQEGCISCTPYKFPLDYFLGDCRFLNIIMAKIKKTDFRSGTTSPFFFNNFKSF